jgi:hypothetical protein
MGGGRYCGKRESNQPFFLGVAEQGQAAVYVQFLVDVVQVDFDRALADVNLTFRVRWF